MFGKIKDFAFDKKLIHKNDNVIVGVSGGADSVFLVYFFDYLKNYLDFNYSIVHFNHCLRETALRDETFVREISKKLKVPFYNKSEDVALFAEKSKKSIEMAARELRYSFFNELVEVGKGNKIAIAHNLTDNLETVLINMARGTGIRGISGISDYTENLIRPLLNTTSIEIRKFLIENSMVFMEDETNSDDKFLRNRVRKFVIPSLIKAFGLNAEQKISKTIAQINETEKVLSFLISGQVSDYCYFFNHCLRIKRDFLKNCPRIVQKELVVYFVEKLNGSSYHLTSGLIDGVCDFLSADEFGEYKPSKNLNITFVRSGESIYLYNDKFQNNCLRIPSKGECIIFPGVNVIVKHTNKFNYSENKNVLYIKSEKNFVVSPVNEGDFIVLNGKTRYDVNKLMKKSGMGAFKRKHLPVFKINDEVLWIPGYFYSDNIENITEYDDLLEVYIHDLLM